MLGAQSPQSAFTHPPSPSSGSYKPPKFSSNAEGDDPGIQKAFAHLYTGDKSGFQAELRNQAESGDPFAQLMLGEQYIPKEMYAPMSPAEAFSNHGQLQPKIVPALDTSPMAKLFPPSYTEALKWLTLASAQGSGEASELIAQIITRMLDSHTPTLLTTADAAHYRSLAVQQGYDLENSSVSCFQLIHGAQSLTCKDVLKSCPTADEMQQLRTAGLSGTLEPQGGANGGLNSISLHPAGPPARALIILDRSITTEQRLPLPRHTSVMYVQQAHGWLTLPQTGSSLDRDIVLTPGENPNNAVMVYVQNIDGSHSGAYCIHSIGPFPH